MLFQVGGQGTRPTFFEMAAAQQLPASLRAALTYSLGVLALRRPFLHKVLDLRGVYMSKEGVANGPLPLSLKTSPSAPQKFAFPVLRAQPMTTMALWRILFSAPQLRAAALAPSPCEVARRPLRLLQRCPLFHSAVRIRAILSASEVRKVIRARLRDVWKSCMQMCCDQAGAVTVLGDHPDQAPIRNVRPRRIIKPPPPRILLNNVSCLRNSQNVLRYVNISAHDGSAIVLTGVNGSGKTTFLRMMAGFSRPSEGQILWNGHDVQSPGVFQQYKLQLNWMSLKNAINDKMTVLHNVEWFEALEGKSGKAMWALELMGLGRLAKKSVTMLSSGQKKRLQLARVVALDRPIWLLDEPSVALDTEGVQLLEFIIAEHRKAGGIVFVATHQPIEIEDPMILRLPQRFPREMNSGKIIAL